MSTVECVNMRSTMRLVRTPALTLAAAPNPVPVGLQPAASSREAMDRHWEMPCILGLIRFRGHRPKGGYDGQNGIKAGRETSATTVL